MSLLSLGAQPRHQAQPDGRAAGAAASSPDLGEARESLPTEYKGGPVEIGFNAQYLLDFLGAAGTETVQLDLKDSESQGTLRPAPGGDTDYRYVVMPIRL